VCTKNDCPDFFFDHTDTTNLYYSPDIDPGTTGQLHAGTNYTAKVRVHNSGAAGTATVTLYVSPPGTNVIPGGAVALGGEADTSNPVPACTGTVGSGDVGAGVSDPNWWSFSWDPGSYFVPHVGNLVHTCLFAQVRLKASLGCAAVPYPASNDPTQRGNAQHNIDIVGVELRILRKDRKMHFGFGVVNPLDETVQGLIVARPVHKAQPEFQSLLRMQSLAHLQQHGQLRAPAAAGLVLGKERIVTPRVSQAELRRRSDREGYVHKPYFLGHTGEVDQATFKNLAIGPAERQQRLQLLPGEIHQAFVEVEAPAEAKPGDFFITDIRHEVERGGVSHVLGGLVVVFQIVEEQKAPRERTESAA
jgi:hypothetical protein